MGMLEVLRCPRHPDAHPLLTHPEGREPVWRCVVCMDELHIAPAEISLEVEEDDTQDVDKFWGVPVLR